ncbi:MAG: hypothetical protein GF353_28155 [Candidatus Lokiarchaeota archaeon]|nr:hypothetical protein [Candidatus Lokiarchaeota archaeon]
MKQLFLIVMIISFSTASPGQTIQSSADNGQVFAISSTNPSENSSDSSAVILEDLFGRFTDGFSLLSSLDNNITSDDRNADNKYSKYYLSASYGKRESLTLGIQIESSKMDSPFSRTSNIYNGFFKYRPFINLQISSTVRFLSYTNLLNNYDVSFSLDYLTRGHIGMSSAQLYQIHYFNNVFLNRNQVLIGISPSILKSSDPDNDSYSSQSYEFPVSVRYGLFDNLTVGLDYERANVEYKSFAEETEDTILDEHSSIGTNDMFQIALQYLISSSLSIAGSTDLYFVKDRSEYRSIYSNGYIEYHSFVDKTKYYTIQGKLNYLTNDNKFSPVDLRQSLYNGNYLKKGHFTNELSFCYLSPNSPEFAESIVGNSSNYGLSSWLQLVVDGEVTFMKDIFRQTGNIWSYSIGSIFHNLNFTEPELNNSDYYFGKILLPMDFIGGVSWAHSNNSVNSKSLNAEFQIGILKDLDMKIGYRHHLNEPQDTDINNQSLSFALRANIFRKFRIEFNTHYALSSFKNSPDRFNTFLYQNFGTDMTSYGYRLELKTIF